MAPRVKSAKFERLYLGRKASDRETVFTTRCVIAVVFLRTFFVGGDFADLSPTSALHCWRSRGITLKSLKTSVLFKLHALGWISFPLASALRSAALAVTIV